MTLTFLLAPPSDTLGLVLKSPSKLNIFRFFPLTSSDVDTDFWKRKRNEKWTKLKRNGRANTEQWRNEKMTWLLAQTCTQLNFWWIDFSTIKLEQVAASSVCTLRGQIKQLISSMWTTVERQYRRSTDSFSLLATIVSSPVNLAS